MTAGGTVGLEQLDVALAGAAPILSVSEQRLALTVYRLLAAGRPVTAGAIAAATGDETEGVERSLRSWPGVFRDSAGSVIGFWGLALSETPHRLRVAGANLYAWCAWDPLFLAHIVGPLEVATEDPITGETIEYSISTAGTIQDLTHPHAVLSFLRPDRPWDDDVRVTFCHYVRQFTDVSSAGRWTSKHPSTFIISQADGVALARRHIARTFGAVSSVRT